jgi:hypothetical protein
MINTNETIKKYLPEIWFYLVKVKSLHFKSLSHYFAAMAINSNDIGECILTKTDIYIFQVSLFSFVII